MYNNREFLKQVQPEFKTEIVNTFDAATHKIREMSSAEKGDSKFIIKELEPAQTREELQAKLSEFLVDKSHTLRVTETTAEGSNVYLVELEVAENSETKE